MGFKETISNLFKSKAEVEAEAEKRRLSEEHHTGIRQILRDKNIGVCRPVGGVFRLDDGAREKLRAQVIQRPFETAGVLVHDSENGTSGAYMAGRLTDGTFDIISLRNLGRQDDLQSLGDSIDARRCAHRMRENLKSMGELLQEEPRHAYAPALKSGGSALKLSP